MFGCHHYQARTCGHTDDLNIQENLLFSDRFYVGRKIFSAMKRPQDIVYIPRYWTIIMTVVRSIPE